MQIWSLSAYSSTQATLVVTNRVPTNETQERHQHPPARSLYNGVSQRYFNRLQSKKIRHELNPETHPHHADTSKRKKPSTGEAACRSLKGRPDILTISIKALFESLQTPAYQAFRHPVLSFNSYQIVCTSSETKCRYPGHVDWAVE